MPRLFFALWPDPRTREALAAAADALDIRDGRRVRDENLHLTLAFLGQVDDACAARLAGLSFSPAPAPVVLDVTATGWWRGAGVAWLAPETPPPALTRLRDRILDAARGAGAVPDPRAYRPHITVARAVRRAPRARGSIATHWQADDFALVESHTESAGARYVAIRRWALDGGAGD